jgi:type II secretory pathway component GspD/PulD (secretin)
LHRNCRAETAPDRLVWIEGASLAFVACSLASFGQTALKGEKMKLISVSVSVGLALALLAPGAGAQTQPANSKPAEPNPGPETYQTLYLTNLTSQSALNDIQTDLRNMLPRARVYGVAAESAISLHGTPGDMLLAQKILSELDRPRKAFRLTYTITETDNGKRVGVRHFTLIVVSDEKVGKTVLKEGSRVPLVTGTENAGTPAQNSQVQYVDVGLNIQASLDGEKLYSKVEQSSLAEEKPAAGAQHPVICQTTLEGTAALTPGHPLLLGSLDLPGGARHMEIEVVSEPVR